MEIAKILGCTEDQISNKEFNIFIGISLGNKYFTKDRIRKYLLWAIENTRDYALALVADEIQAINYEVFKCLAPEEALSRAMSHGNDIYNSIIKIRNGLATETRRKIKIARWSDVTTDSNYKSNLSVLLREFDRNRTFKLYVLKIVGENLGKKLTIDDEAVVDKLASYVLLEIPALLNGVTFEGCFFDLHPYPGLSSLDELLVGIQEGELFTELRSNLDIHRKISIVEGYV
jgi:tRNA-dependent cyclodipeptide synthase